MRAAAQTEKQQFWQQLEIEGDLRKLEITVGNEVQPIMFVRLCLVDLVSLEIKNFESGKAKFSMWVQYEKMIKLSWNLCFDSKPTAQKIYNLH